MAALGDTDPSVRAAAVSSIGQMRNERMTRTMGETLAKDPEPAVRRAAAWALSTQNSEAARRGLEAATADPDAWVRQAAVSALNQWEERVERQIALRAAAKALFFSREVGSISTVVIRALSFRFSGALPLGA